MEYILLGYTYYTYCQGTQDRNYGTALIEIPGTADFITAREILFNRKHIENRYEIDIDSIENLTVGILSGFVSFKFSAFMEF